jgi:hypothetical protein
MQSILGRRRPILIKQKLHLLVIPDMLRRKADLPLPLLVLIKPDPL